MTSQHRRQSRAGKRIPVGEIRVQLDIRRAEGEEAKHIPVPRDGGLADLLAEAENPAQRGFEVLICEDISRIGRRNYISTEIEHRLEQAGVLLVAADEPVRLGGYDGRRTKRAARAGYPTNTQALIRYPKSHFLTEPATSWGNQ